MSDIEPTLAWPRFIPVTERLPEIKKNCFVYTDSYGWMLGMFDGEQWHIFGWHGDPYNVNPTHWLPMMPKPEVIYPFGTTCED